MPQRQAEVQRIPANTYMLVHLLCATSPRFRDRLKSMGKLDDLTVACSDTCCEGANDPRQHVTMKIFPHLKKWPLADAFHKTQIVTDSMIAGHPDYAQAVRYDTFPRLCVLLLSFQGCKRDSTTPHYVVISGQDNFYFAAP